ncbi:MAG: response regulator transcription factor [Planctomycetota bacterium]
MMTSILTIEDDPSIRRGIVDALTFHGYFVIEAANGNDGLEKATTAEYDLLLLDLALPGISGLQILKELRNSRPTQPVIILTAKGDETDRVNGLKSGADDYVVKPFSVKELMARVEAVLRRTPERPSTFKKITFPQGTVDLDRHEIRFQDGTRAELSEKETELIGYLANHRGRAVSRDELLSSVWRLSPKGISTRTIDMHIARLREKLNDTKLKPTILLTVRGKGYMWAENRQGDS